MKHNAFIALFLFVAFLIALIGLAPMASWEGCLIYGIDFNGKNEPFGLFCR